ncbi:DNA cytosine methyltransferase [Sphingobacterium psychroaquaticum]|uniref:DNA cytosine methyltransferase n=1 Tax=Sphingobacterium psychroaquaticum TaxID=561061 RepID=UPI001069B560|nr:DNA cytosine methyltransferase [Sphingobacterium psychroaquaticum]QBQ41233.1 DNA cytosine methyltransferase [Sphingobacterium psychroaquaticum]
MINAFVLQHKPFTPTVVQAPEDVQFVIVDLFCGAGGTTIGFDQARNTAGNRIAVIAACVNHDHKAIRSHWENHPEVFHFEEDIRTLQLDPLITLVNTYRNLYPKAKLVLWASLECTNFSKAKGGQARDADSRTLADHLDRYIQAINPDYVQIENVVEFMSWGPLNEKGKPVSMKSGQDWMRWRNHINSFGYRDEWRELNSADFGAYTSRNRLFGCFAKDGLPIVWPTATHSKKVGNTATLFDSYLQKWKPVKDVLDFSDEGESIFTRKKPLVEATLRRIYAGLVKHVAGGTDSFITKYFSGRPAGKVTSVDNPLGTITTSGSQSLVQASFISRYFSGKPEGQIASVNNPLGTITTVDHHSIINASFLTKYYGTGENVASIDEPAGTLTTKDRFTKVQVNWLDKQYSGEHNHQSINQPAGTIMTSDKHALVSAPFILNPSHGGHTMHCNQPCPVIVARQDKAPLYLVQYSQSDSHHIPIYEGDSETMIKIKEFMAFYGISDIKMRMLKVSELKVIQGFPADYKLYGNQSDQKKFIGNSVVPLVVKCWCESQGKEILKQAA